MKRGRRVVTFVGTGLGLVLVLLWVSGVLRDRIGPGRVEHPPGFALPPDAEIVDVGEAPLPRATDVPGTAVSERQVRMRSRIHAPVVRLAVSAGQTVAEGEVLAELDDRDLQEAVRAAQAVVAQAQASYDRTRLLHERQAVTDQALEEAESRFRASRAQADQAEVMLSYARIASPLDGQVADTYVEAGDLVGPGQELLTLFDPGRMRVEAHLPMRLAPHLQVGDTLAVHLDGRPEPVAGEVTEIAGAVDEVTRTRRIKVRLGDDTPVLPGTYGRVRVPEPPRPGIRIPETAVLRSGQLELVQVATPENRVVRRLVRTGLRDEGLVEILSGLRGGERILAVARPEGSGP